MDGDNLEGLKTSLVATQSHIYEEHATSSAAASTDTTLQSAITPKGPVTTKYPKSYRAGSGTITTKSPYVANFPKKLRENPLNHVARTRKEQVSPPHSSAAPVTLTRLSERPASCNTVTCRRWSGMQTLRHGDQLITPRQRGLEQTPTLGKTAPQRKQQAQTA